MRRFVWLLCVLSLIAGSAWVRAEEPGAANVKYAAVFYDSASAPAASAKDTRNLTYILADPMIGNFTLDQLDISGGMGPAALDKVMETLKNRGANASIAFYYFQGSAESKLEGDAGAAARFLDGLPGRVKVVVSDLTTSGASDAKPELSVKGTFPGEGEGVLELTLKGAAAESNTGSALLFEALRGNADANRDRKVTIGELVSFVSEKATGAASYDLSGLADIEVVNYRTPAQVTQSLGPEKSLDLAAEYGREERWVESLLVLREIRDAKVTDPKYRQISEAAQLNLSLEARYSPDYRPENVGRDVKAGLDLLSDMVLLANMNYVSDVDNRALFAGGIRNLQLLLDNSRVRAELLPKENAKMAGEFAVFLKETAGHVYEKDVLPEADFIMRIRRVLMENAATVKLPDGVIVTEFVYGIPAALDPHTDYIPRMAYKEFQDDTKGHFGGIGIEITLEDKILTIVTPLDDTPGAGAGLLPGDRIVAIEGEKTDGIDLVEAVNKLRGPVGTKVTITVVHRGDTAPADYTITRGDITMRSTRGYAVDDETGQWDYFVDKDAGLAYARLTDFKDNSPDELEKVIDLLTRQGMKGLVLDLRFNHGGLLKSGVEISDKFLKSGTIVTMQGEHTRPSTFKAHYFRTFPDFPLVVLVNDQSASAAEIVAGALQDNKRATIVGTRTFGKGTVQTVFELEHGQSALKITTAKYYTPAGRCIHREPYSDQGGLDPDIVVPMSEEDSALLVDVWHLRGLKKDARGRLMEKDRESAAKNPDMKIADPDTFRDPQLEKALEILRGMEKENAQADTPGEAGQEREML